MNKRLFKLFTDSWGGVGDGDILDCYNQHICKDISCTIHTRIDQSSNYWVFEKVKYEGRK